MPLKRPSRSARKLAQLGGFETSRQTPGPLATTVKLGRASAALVLCATLNAAAGLLRPFSSRFPRSSSLTTASSSDAAADQDLAILGLGTKPRGEIAYRTDRGVARAFGKADLAEGRVALRDTRTKTKLAAV